MRHSILLFLLANAVSWGADNICTLRNGGTACSSNSCTASLIAADTANSYFTGNGCTGNGYTPWTNSDNVVIPSGFTLTDDVGGIYGNYNGPMMSYISSLAVAPNSTAGCSRPTASISGGTQGVYTVNAPSLTTDPSGAITAANLNFERVWYTAGSAQPTVTINGGGCTYLNNYTPATAITPVWVQGGGTPALTIAGGTSAFIAASAVTFRGDIQYDLSYPATLSFIMNAGSSLTWDSSGTSAYADGLHTVYGFTPSNRGGGSLNVVFQANGASTSHVTITSNAGGANGTFLAQHNCSGAPKYSITMSYTDLSNLGSPIDPIYDGLLQNSCGDTAIWNVTNSKFTGVGSASVYQGSGTTETLIHQYNVHTNQLGVADLALYGISPLAAGGTRNVSNNVFGSQFGCRISGSYNSGSTMAGVTVSGNYFADSTCPIGAMAMSLSGTLSYNLMRQYIYAANVPETESTINGNYFVFVGPMFNPHLVSNSALTGNATWSGNVVDLQEDITGADASYILGAAPVSGSYVASFLNNIFPRTKQGHGQGWTGNSLNTNFNAHRTLAMNHNIAWGRNMKGVGPGGGNYQGLVMIDHGGTTSTTMNSLKSNIEVGLGGGYSAFKFSSIQFNSPTTPATPDMCTPSTCDYNAGYQITNANNCGGVQSTTCPNAGNGYNSGFSNGATPGPHDIDVVLGLTASGGINPQFADPSRNLATWDTAYLHNTASTGAWDGSGVSYTVGQTAALSQAGIWGGSMINYRVIAAHTSSVINQPDLTLTSANGHITQVVVSTSPQTQTWTTDVAHGLSAGQLVNVWGLAGDNTPLKLVTAVTTYTFTTANTGASANTYTKGLSAQIWRNFWEYASEYDQRTAIGAGTTYTDGSINCMACLPVQALVNWIMAGHIVMNPALWLAGHDGDDVGAASLANVQHIPPMMTVP